PLILAGGRSTRMQSPKHLLPMPDGRPLYQHQLDLLAAACPNAPAIYISLAQDSILDDFLRSLPVANNTAATATTTNTSAPLGQSSQPPTSLPASSPPRDSGAKPQVLILRDLPANPSPSRSAGPATGLLTAHCFFPSTTWFTIPCDHPFLTPSLLQHLCEQYQPPVTCFRNGDGFLEPLVAVWGPQALARM
ncbi:hypothetical protein N657DRAFT_560307, partial [Parathielavia appendiculata]